MSNDLDQLSKDVPEIDELLEVNLEGLFLEFCNLKQLKSDLVQYNKASQNTYFVTYIALLALFLSTLIYAILSLALGPRPLEASIFLSMTLIITGLIGFGFYRRGASKRAAWKDLELCLHDRGWYEEFFSRPEVQWQMEKTSTEYRNPAEPDSLIAFLAEYLPRHLRKAHIRPIERRRQELKSIGDEINATINDKSALAYLEKDVQADVLRRFEFRRQAVEERINRCHQNIQRIERLIAFLTTRVNRLKSQQRAIDIIRKGEEIDKKIDTIGSSTDEFLYVQEQKLLQLVQELRDEFLVQHFSLNDVESANRFLED